MKRCIILIVVPVAFMLSCADRSAERAEALLVESRSLAAEGSFSAARVLIDSLNATYPKCVEQRRAAKVLEDSLVYVESCRTVRYADSVLAVLLPQADEQLRLFRYEKNERYEDAGRYVHRLLRTDSNTSRCFLQAYVTDTRVTQVKAYYAGSARADINCIRMMAGYESLDQCGQSHIFEAEGWHGVLTFEGDKAIEILNFVSSNAGERLRVELCEEAAGRRKSVAVLYLGDSEKQALQATYALGILMNDIHRLEDMRRVGRARMEKYEQRY